MTRPVDKAILFFGGVTKLSEIVGLSYVAVKKWRKSGFFPRTDYTGETNYVEKIVENSNGCLSKDELLPPYPKCKTQQKNP